MNITWIYGKPLGAKSVPSVPEILMLAMLLAIIGYSHNMLRKQLRLEPRGSSIEQTLPAADSIRLCAMGYDQVLADCYWLSFIQYVGDSEGRARDKYAQAEQYINLITELDPKLVQAYWFAAFVIGSDADQPKVAARIIDKGIQSNPNNWALPFIAGINQYLYAHDDVAAAKYYRMAARFPDAPKWLSRQAEILGARIPARIKEINAWDSVYRSSEDPLIREKARAKLISLWRAVYLSANNSVIKNRAKAQLSELEAAEQ